MSSNAESSAYSPKGTISITFGERAENHKGMQMLGGDKLGEGFTIEDMEEMYMMFTMFFGLDCDLIDLNEMIEEEKVEAEKAAVLVIRGGVDALLNIDKKKEDEKKTHKDLFKELVELDWDKKAYMYGRVVNKKARYNLCFAEEAQEPDYEEKKGRVIAFDSVQLLKRMWNVLEVCSDKAKGLQCEGNYYYDTSKCGIGYHGDGERRIVVALRLGETMEMHYQWYHEGEKIGNGLYFDVNGGDMYIMSAKATGWDWKSKKIPTLRHAAGCKKYTDGK